jgi:hypothetical protein
MVFTLVGPKTSDLVVTDSARSFLSVFVLFGITTFLTCDSDDVRASLILRLQGDERDGAFVVFILLVGEDSSFEALVRLPLLAMGVKAGIEGGL